MIPQEKWFYFASGKKASSIEELRSVLEAMDEAEFRHYVNNEKNDFANWVEGVFKEKRLAQNMREVSEREGLLIILEDFLKKKLRKTERHKKIKRLIIPKEKRISPESGKELSEQEIKNIVDEAREVFEKEEQPRARKTRHLRDEQHRFIVKEFIYGFLLGLIFGLIMLGIIFNLNF